MHDDLIDKNMLRRGKPALHKLFGDEIAIIAGDMVHMILWRMAIDATLSLNGTIGMAYFNKLYDIMMVTHQGQYYDINNSINGGRLLDFTEEEYFKSIHAKSAYYSVYGPMQCGAIIAGANNEEMEKIKEYGTLCGNAFQIKDDILDCISTENVLGKSIGTDVKESTRTLILWHSVHNASASMLKRIEAIYAKKNKSDEEVKFIIDTFKELGSIEYAEKRAAKLTDMALSAFEKNTQDIKEGAAKNIARSGIGHVTNRKK
jgi:geranylgeranyl pyrophosphate synthase